MRIFSAKAIRIPYTWPEKTRFVLQGFARVAKDEQHAAVESSFRKSGYDNPGLNPGEWIKAPPFMAPVGSGWLMSEVTLTVLMNIPFQSGALSEDVGVQVEAKPSHFALFDLKGLRRAVL